MDGPGIGARGRQRARGPSGPWPEHSLSFPKGGRAARVPRGSFAVEHSRDPLRCTARQAAESMIPIIGQLYREHNVVPTMFGKAMVNVGAIDVLKVHRCGADCALATTAPRPLTAGPDPPHSFGRKHMQASISPDVSLAILRAFTTLDMTAPTRLDVGKATVLCEVCKRAAHGPAAHLWRRSRAWRSRPRISLPPTTPPPSVTPLRPSSRLT